MSPSDSKAIRREDHFSLLDMLLVVAESWRLLVVVPLVVALVAFAVTTQLPRAEAYRASAVLLLSPSAAQTLQSSSYVRAVVGEGGGSGQKATVADGEGWRGILSSISVTKLPESDLFEVSVTGSSGDSALRVLNLIVGGISSPSFIDSSRRALEESIDASSKRLRELNEAVSTLRGTLEGMSSSESPVADANSYAQAIDILSNAIMASQVSLGADTRALAAWPTPEVVEGPTLTSSSPSPRATVMFAGLVSGFLVLLFIFVRDGWRRAAANAESRDKLQRIKRAFGIGGNRKVGPS